MIKADEHGWPIEMLAPVLGIKPGSLKRWHRRQHRITPEPKRRGRPEAIKPEVRWKLRLCYLKHYGQWGPSVLRCWAIREGLGRFATSTIAAVIEDLKPTPAPQPKPRRFEIAASMVMWSEDGTSFRDRGRKRELLVLQDDCARYKVNRRLADGPATAELVAEYLREAFETQGAPLVLKHDGGAIFHEEQVLAILDEYDVVALTSPPRYPAYNGKKERSMRDIKSYVRALGKNGVGQGLKQRIDLALRDLNVERPRPVLKGRTATEVFDGQRVPLPDRKRFRQEVERRQQTLEARAGSRREVQAARRLAVVQVLSRYDLLTWRGDVTTNFEPQRRTN